MWQNRVAPAPHGWIDCSSAPSPSWEQFYQRYWPTLYAFARSLGCSEDAAGEVVQQAIVLTFDKGLSFRYDPTQGSFRNWVHRLRGKASNRKTDPAVRQKVVALCRETYAGFGPTLVGEYLLTLAEPVSLSHDTLRRWPLAQG